MSQRSEYVNLEIPVTLTLKVVLKLLSNHEGFKEGQVDKAIEEFKESIQEELESKICTEYYSQEFLYASDFVTYEVKP